MASKLSGVNGLAVAAAGAGLLFIWSGVKGASITSSLRSLLAGQQPKGTETSPLSSAGGSALASVPNTAVGSGSFAAILGGRYSNSQLQGLWIMAGGNPSKAAVAACISQHEDGAGDPNVTSPNPDGGINVGLWQLDTKGKGAGHTVAQLQNPLTNARLAVTGSADGTDWSAWSTAASCGV